MGSATFAAGCTGTAQTRLLAKRQPCLPYSRGSLRRRRFGSTLQRSSSSIMPRQAPFATSPSAGVHGGHWGGNQDAAGKTSPNGGSRPINNSPTQQMPAALSRTASGAPSGVQPWTMVSPDASFTRSLSEEGGVKKKDRAFSRCSPRTPQKVKALSWTNCFSKSGCGGVCFRQNRSAWGWGSGCGV